MASLFRRALSRRRLTFVLSTLTLIGAGQSARAQSLDLQTASGGVAVSGSSATSAWTASVGNGNGLGVGTPSANVGVTTAGVTGGALYTTPVNLILATNGNQKAQINVYASTLFGHPAVLQIRLCYPAANCALASNFVSLSTTSASPTELLGSPGFQAGTYPVQLGVIVANTNGASAFAGADQVTLTFRTYRTNDNNEKFLMDTDTLTLGITSQPAITLRLATAGGLTVTGGPAYGVNYGTVNGLGIGTAGTGLTVTTSTAGALYSTPYAVGTTFSGFTPTAATIKAHVSTDFAHPAALELRDSPNNSTFTALSKSGASPSTLTTAATSGASLTRYLGLFVGSVNGAGAALGAENAVVTFTAVVP